MPDQQKIECPRCGYQNDPENEFCDYCGFNLAGYFGKKAESDGETESELYSFKTFPSRSESHSEGSHKPAESQKNDAKKSTVHSEAPKKTTHNKKTTPKPRPNPQIDVDRQNAVNGKKKDKNLKKKPKQNAHPKVSPKPKAKKQPVKPNGTGFKHKKLWIFSAAALVLIVGGYGYGRYYYSKSATLNRLTDSVADGKTANYFVSKTEQQDINKMVADYLKANPDLANHLKSELGSKDRTSDGFFTYQKTGTHFGIFPKYQVVMNKRLVKQRTYSINIKTKPHALILLNGKVMSFADDNGNYHLSNLTSDHIYLSAKYHRDDKGPSTPVVKVTPKDNGRQIELVGDNTLNASVAQSTLNDVYEQMQKITNQGNVRTNLSSYFTDAKNNHYYQSVHQLALIFHQSKYQAVYQPKVLDVKKVGNDRYSVDYNLTYRFDNDDQIHTQIFKTNAVMQGSDGEYKINSIISDSNPIKDEYHQK
ncbi:zinc-ribbon domain-containing protein [Nicoliella spurrieriana]|uniref:Zinc-ribbon domain-containing protein n=1 Tax=Nicoliella spurrieriana TaxID=2925830 RepID=A0A976RSN5_9LACO|nr:zinc ribbon domain-containing protein [Nicoliella spurrieriana]UQS87177.1 zinc-ribbon domain-containing protein [Nicoliella spurrieriana]